MAVGASLRAEVRGTRSDSRQADLCRAVGRAGDCAGGCGAIAEALATCWSGAFRPPPQSTLPAAAPDEQVLLFGAYEGDAISTTTLTGQDGETQTARVVIAPGVTPLYLVLSSYESIIWRFEGDVSRLSHVVLIGDGPDGVTGISADRVADLAATSASVPDYFYEPSSPDAQRIRAAIEAALGRPLDTVAGSYSVGTLSLPSATADPSVTPPEVPPGFDPAVYEELGLWFNPGGIVEIDPADVVSTNPAEAYEVLPEGFGLAQLVATGALESRGDYFYIARAIPRFPAGLYGAHSVSFVLGRGVPMPAGSPGHSCVISEDSGLPITDAGLCGIFLPPSYSCVLPAAPAADQVVLFGAYEGDAMSTVTINGQDEETVTARVVVESGTTPLYIVLAAYSDMIWRFEGATSRVDRVVLLGYGAQGVTGISSSQVADLSNGAAGSCFDYFYDVQSPDGVAARAATEHALGRAVDVFAGSYAVGTLSLPSATVTPSATPTGVPPGFDPAVFQMLGLWFSPGGIVTIESSQVVSTQPAEPYVVLPQGFGLAQLVATGGLEVRDLSLFSPTFRIARPIPRFPAGLYGAQAVSFILGRGVPMPAGDPGHSCVISEDTGQPISNEFLCSIFAGESGS